jgi:hypothetical protein
VNQEGGNKVVGRIIPRYKGTGLKLLRYLNTGGSHFQGTVRGEKEVRDRQSTNAVGLLLAAQGYFVYFVALLR